MPSNWTKSNNAALIVSIDDSSRACGSRIRRGGNRLACRPILAGGPFFCRDNRQGRTMEEIAPAGALIVEGNGPRVVSGRTRWHSVQRSLTIEGRGFPV
jgi:hypothetical protein